MVRDLTAAVRNLDGWNLAVLGPVRAWRDGQELPLGPPQQRLFLAALALRPGGRVGAGELADRLWDAAPPA
ncbi:AfsR/SARP family transcriptional regulator, partial [Actinocorallia lasiicapitis]